MIFYKSYNFSYLIILMIIIVTASSMLFSIFYAYTDLDEPTVNDCSREETYRQAIIVGASVIGGVLLFIAVLVFIFSCYACHRSRQRTGRQKNMPNEERMHLQNQNTNLTTKLCQETDKEKKEDIRKRLEMNDKQLQGDGPDSETSETHDHSETSAL